MMKARNSDVSGLFNRWFLDEEEKSANEREWVGTEPRLQRYAWHLPELMRK